MNAPERSCGINQTFDFRSTEKAARQRIHAQFADKYLSVLNEVDPKVSIEMGCEQQLGASVLGKIQIARDTAMAKATQRFSTEPSDAMASV